MCCCMWSKRRLPSTSPATSPPASAPSSGAARRWATCSPPMSAMPCTFTRCARPARWSQRKRKVAAAKAAPAKVIADPPIVVTVSRRFVIAVSRARPIRPVNGLLLVIPADSLIEQKDGSYYLPLTQKKLDAIPPEQIRLQVKRNCPDEEQPGQPSAASVEREAREAGLEFRYIPVVSGQITSANVEHVKELLEPAEVADTVAVMGGDLTDENAQRGRGQGVQPAFGRERGSDRGGKTSRWRGAWPPRPRRY